MSIAGLILIVSAFVGWKLRHQRSAMASLQAEIDRREAEEQKNSALREQLVHSQRLEAIGTLAAGVAHDINNSLTVIAGNAELASLEQLPGSAGYRHLQSILDATNMAANTTRGMLTFSGRSDRVVEPVDLAALLQKVCRFVGRTLPKTIDFTMEIERELQVMADPAKLQQVLLNLILNARDAISAQGQIFVRLQASGAEPASALIEVVDDGAGMTAHVQENLFDPFFTTKPEGTGTGLGMAVVQNIVIEHHGEIQVESEVGRGTTFRIVLPLHVSGPVTGHDTSAPKPRSASPRS